MRHLKALPDPEPESEGGGIPVYRFLGFLSVEEGEKREYGVLRVADDSRVTVLTDEGAEYGYSSLNAATAAGWRPD